MSNYSGIIYRIQEVRPHSNADRLNCSNILTNNVILGKATQAGDLGVFFPVECQLSTEFCAANDLIRRKDESGKPAGGMLEDNRRVKCIVLRGEKSMGFWCPITYLEKWAAYCGFELPFMKEGQEIDSVSGKELCRKYEIKQSRTHSPGRNGQKVAKAKIDIVDGQFKFHFDSSPLWKNGDKLNPNSIVSVSNKLHGSLFQVSRLLVKRKLNWKDKLAKFFGVSVVEEEYQEIAASRTVIKTKNSSPGYYGEDLWSDILETMFKGHLKKGETIYGEVVNQTRSGKWIQKNYTYGFPPSTPGVFIYRITQASPDGNIVELSWPQMKARSIELGHPHVPELFYGTLKDIFPSIDYTDTRWGNVFVEKFYEKYAPDVKCPLSNTGVFAEGSVLRVEGNEIVNYKAKSAAFLQGESQTLDSGVVDISDADDI